MSEKGLDRASNGVHWIARGLGTLVGVYWLAALFIPPLVGEGEPLTLEGGLLASFVVVSVVGIGVAWWREGIGGIVTTFGGVALSIFAYVTAGRNKALAVLLAGAPFLIAGLLFITSWQRSKQR